MQDVNFDSYPTSDVESIEQNSRGMYSGPMAMKQHAERLKKFTIRGRDEWEITSKTSSTYHSNFNKHEDYSDIESKLIHDEDIDIKELLNHQKQLMELQNNVQNSLKMIQQKLHQSNNKPNKKADLKTVKRKYSINDTSSRFSNDVRSNNGICDSKNNAENV